VMDGGLFHNIQFKHPIDKNYVNRSQMPF
jgi:hypothetical protein